ncbi:MAG TPA: class I tRNA ligase family protein [Streptosporangiaceae bacterium]|nr:class I tRNA ligase family protein [Streptosporangiaceae bacterium]
MAEPPERAELRCGTRPWTQGRFYERWISSGLFTVDPTRNPARPLFSMVIPPPNVIGSLHIGHAPAHCIRVMHRRRRTRRLTATTAGRPAATPEADTAAPGGAVSYRATGGRPIAPIPPG